MNEMIIEGDWRADEQGVAAVMSVVVMMVMSVAIIKTMSVVMMRGDARGDEYR